MKILVILNIILLITACRQVEKSDVVKRDTFYQYAVWYAFVNQIYDGLLTVKELKQHGDTGLGSFNGLDGEMVMLDGITYCIRENGEVSVAADNDTLVYANATFFDGENSFTLEGQMNLDSLKGSLLKRINSPNLFYAFIVKATLDSVLCGGLARQYPPYKYGLDTLIPARPIFKAANIPVTMVGFYCPDYIGNINTKGFHFHLISDDKNFGGHLISFKATKMKVEFDEMDNYQFQLPNTPEFRKVGFSKEFQYKKD